MWRYVARRPWLGVFLCALGVIPNASGSIVFTCPDATPACNGNLYAVSLVSQAGNTYVLQFGIQVTNAYTGGQSDLLHSIALSDFTSFATRESLLSAPGSLALWQFADGVLNANSCNGNTGGVRLCAQAAWPFAGSPLFQSGAPVGVLSFQFQFDSPTPLFPTVHVKYLYTDAAGIKVGSLGSFGLPIQCLNESCEIPPGGHTPEPVTAVLTAMGLLAVALLRRFRAGAERKPGIRAGPRPFSAALRIARRPRRGEPIGRPRPNGPA